MLLDYGSVEYWVFVTDTKEWNDLEIMNGAHILSRKLSLAIV